MRFMVICCLALSVMPGRESTLHPIALAIFIVVALFACGYVAVDRLERRVVERMKMKGDVEGLIEALKNGWLACKAAVALGDIPDRKAVAPLVEALYDKDSDVRRAAAKALGDIGDDSTEEPLRAATEYRGVRDCAGYALKKMQRPADAH